MSHLQKLKQLLRYCYSRLIKSNGNEFLYYRGTHKHDLLLFDTMFPHPVSGFRLEEFKVLLTEFNDSRIITTPASYTIVKTPIAQHANDIADLPESIRRKVFQRKGLINVNAKLFYCVFLTNISRNLAWLEEYEVPFAFTLYPGGGFVVGDPDCDAIMKSVFSSKQFRHVVVTQRYTRDYLIDKGFCTDEQITYIFGVVVPQESLHRPLTGRLSFPVQKPTFDICFCAAKYLPRGEDKGYDVFIEMALNLAKSHDNARFHIIGGFMQTDIDVTALGDKITFYGYQDFSSLEPIYKKMDILVSPNQPFMLQKGAFDGFPLGTAIEAALNGVAVLAADALQQNDHFEDGKDLIIIGNDARKITDQIANLIENPAKLEAIAANGREKCRELYNNATQMSPRLQLLHKLLK